MKNLILDDLVLFENDDLLIINKPSGISTLEDRHDNVNLLGLTRKKYPHIQTCHRLDKDTSGALIFAKNPESYRAISIQFEHRKVEKVYHTVVCGKSNFSNTEVNMPIVIRTSGLVYLDKLEGKPSTTYFTTLTNFSQWSLVECKPVTGRKHQIRIHLKYVQHPIVGDAEYGGTDIFLVDIKRKYSVSDGEAKPIISRVALHARSISFTLPDGNPLTVEAPYPKDFSVLLKQLEKYASGS